MNQYESRKHAREDLKRVIKQQAEKEGKLLTSREIENRANASGDRCDKRSDR